MPKLYEMSCALVKLKLPFNKLLIAYFFKVAPSPGIACGKQKDFLKKKEGTLNCHLELLCLGLKVNSNLCAESQTIALVSQSSAKRR